MFIKRSYQREMMDDFSINDERVDRALDELKIINNFLGGVSATKSGIKKLYKNIHFEKSIKILDAGSGASDNLLPLGNDNYKIYSLDLSKRVCRYVKHFNSNAICGDVLNLPFKKIVLDIAHVSLLLHHFNEVEIKKILSELSSVSRCGIIINDLRRSVFAFVGIKVLTALFSRSEFVKNDGPVSVKRGFRKKDLTKILDDLNFNYKIKRKWAFRWLVVIYLNEK